MYEGRLTYRHLPVSNTKGLFFDQNPSVASCLIWSQSPYLDLLDPTWSSHSPPVLLWPHFLLAFIYSSSHWPSYCSWKVLCTLSLSEPSSCPSSWNILSSKSCLSLLSLISGIIPDHWLLKSNLSQDLVFSISFTLIYFSL